MKKQEWHYVVNQFLTCTKKNFKKALKLSRYHDAQSFKAMNDNPGDAQYILAYTRYHIFHLDMETDYATWISLGGTQESSTLNIKQLLKLKTSKLNKWINTIEGFYPAGSVRHKAILPDLRAPFSGTRSLVIGAFKTLGINIGIDANLTTVRTEVNDYYSDLNIANTSQTGDKGSVTNASTQLEKSRVAAMTGQYQNLGLFIDKFPSDPKSISVLFDVETITNPAQVIWKGHLDAKELLQVLIHTFMDGDLIRCKSVGNAAVTLYLASTPGGIDSAPIVVDGLKELKFDVKLFGVTDYKTNRYLTIVNNSDSLETRFFIQLY